MHTKLGKKGLLQEKNPNNFKQIYNKSISKMRDKASFKKQQP